jgi:hypothetical protein
VAGLSLSDQDTDEPCELKFMSSVVTHVPLGSFELLQTPNEFYSPLGAVHAC